MDIYSERQPWHIIVAYCKSTAEWNAFKAVCILIDLAFALSQHCIFIFISLELQ